MAPERKERRLAAILAADMVGYSCLMEANERTTIARQKVHRAELIDPKITEYRGRIVKTTGDGILVEFSSAVDAVGCAVDIQNPMCEREADQSENQRIHYRIGINVGDIVIDGDDILGDGVNIGTPQDAFSSWPVATQTVAKEALYEAFLSVENAKARRSVGDRRQSGVTNVCG